MDTTTTPESLPKTSKKNDYVDMAKSFGWALLIAMIFRTFLFEPFHIPSGSMKPTLLIGDYIFVSKYSYGISRFSFPLGNWLPDTITGRMGEYHQPERGDIVVFKLPNDPSTNYIKRLIGLPGDKIQVKDGILFVNSTPVTLKLDDPFEDKDDFGSSGKIIQRYTETLPGGVMHSVLDETKDGALDNTEVYTVPAKHYFFMGDNRDNSQDSRVLEKVGYVPEENLVGRAEVVLFSSHSSWMKPWTWVTSLHGEKAAVKG